MRTVSTSPLVRSLVDLDVLDDEVTGVETLGIGIGFGVLEQREEELCGLDGPASLGDTELFAYSVQSTCQPSPPPRTHVNNSHQILSVAFAKRPA